MTGDQWQGIAALVTAIGGLGASVTTVVIALGNRRINRENSDKIDAQGDKVAEIHAATAAIQEATGTHKTLEP